MDIAAKDRHDPLGLTRRVTFEHGSTVGPYVVQAITRYLLGPQPPPAPAAVAARAPARGDTAAAAPVAQPQFLQDSAPRPIELIPPDSADATR